MHYVTGKWSKQEGKAELQKPILPCSFSHCQVILLSVTRKTGIQILYKLQTIIEHVALRGELRKKYRLNFPSGEPQVPLKFFFITNQFVVERVTYTTLCYLSICTWCISLTFTN